MAINNVSLLSPGGGADYSRILLNNILKKDYTDYKALQQQETDVTVKIGSYSGILSNLSVFQNSIDNLKKTNSGILTADVSDRTFASATALDFGTSGNYTLQVQNIATAQSVSSPIYAATTSAVADLTTYPTQKLSIQVGSGTATQITVDATNNTLSGISNSINSANAGVTSAVENSGFVINGANNTISFNDGSSRTATIASGTYTSSGLGRAIKSALESANGGYDTYTVSYDSTANKFSIANDSTNGNQITVDWTTSTARNILGFATTAQSTVAVGSSATSDTASLGTGYSLVLNSNSTGANNKIIVKADVNNDGIYSEAGIEIAPTGLSALAFHATYDASGNVTGGITNMSQSQASVDANFKVNGVSYTRANNSNSDAIQGTTLNLIKGDKYYATTPKTMKIAIYPLMLVNNIRMFASAFSSSKSYLDSLAGDGSNNQSLGGDETYKSLMNDLNSLKNGLYVTSTGIQSLSYVGINFDYKGNMTFDETKLRNSIAEDAISVTNIASQMSLPLSSKLDNYINTVIPAQQDSIDQSYQKIKKAEKKILNQVQIKQQVFQTSFTTGSLLSGMFNTSFNTVDSIANMLNRKA